MTMKTKSQKFTLVSKYEKLKARKSDLSTEVRGLDKELKGLQATLIECKAGYFTTKAVDGYTVAPSVRKTFHTGSIRKVI
tara:strand:+ start:594 stop:833 length:240 start_codon:yes stop_codon:yes gene_type:complete